MSLLRKRLSEIAALICLSRLCCAVTTVTACRFLRSRRNQEHVCAYSNRWRHSARCGALSEHRLPCQPPGDEEDRRKARDRNAMADAGESCSDRGRGCRGGAASPPSSPAACQRMMPARPAMSVQASACFPLLTWSHTRRSSAALATRSSAEVPKNAWCEVLSKAMGRDPLSRNHLPYSSWRRHQTPVSFRPFAARSSHWYVPQRPSTPRA
jgi:hypothetical protein